jgi:hypothetical protein
MTWEDNWHEPFDIDNETHRRVRLNGFLWPEEDVGMRAVAFANLPDLDKALGYVKDFTACVQAGGNVGKIRC